MSDSHKMFKPDNKSKSREGFPSTILDLSYLHITMPYGSGASSALDKLIKQNASCTIVNLTGTSGIEDFEFRFFIEHLPNLKRIILDDLTPKQLKEVNGLSFAMSYVKEIELKLSADLLKDVQKKVCEFFNNNGNTAYADKLAKNFQPSTSEFKEACNAASPLFRERLKI